MTLQRGGDKLSGGDGDDLVVGDWARMHLTYDTELPTVVEVFRAVGALQPLRRSADPISFGSLFLAPQRLVPNEVQHLSAANRMVTATAGSVLTARTMLDLLKLPQRYTPVTAGIDYTKPATVRPKPYALKKHDQVVGDLPFALAGNFFRPYVQVVPGVTRQMDALPRNDTVDGGAGDDIVVGDSITATTVVDFRDNYDMQRAMEGVWDQSSALMYRLWQLNIHADTFRPAVKRAARSAPTKLCVQCDTITGGTGQDVLVGDDLMLISDRYRASKLYTFARSAADVYNYLRDLQTLFVDMDFFVNDCYRRIVASLTSTKSFDTSMRYDIAVGTDTITGSGMLVGDQAVLMAMVLEAAADKYV